MFRKGGMNLNEVPVHSIPAQAGIHLVYGKTGAILTFAGSEAIKPSYRD